MILFMSISPYTCHVVKPLLPLAHGQTGPSLARRAGTRRPSIRRTVRAHAAAANPCPVRRRDERERPRRRDRWDPGQHLAPPAGARPGQRAGAPEGWASGVLLDRRSLDLQAVRPGVRKLGEAVLQEGRRLHRERESLTNLAASGLAGGRPWRHPPHSSHIQRRTCLLKVRYGSPNLASRELSSRKMTPKCRITAIGTTNNSGIQSSRIKPSASCSEHSERYIGFLVNLYGPVLTSATAGRSGRKFVPIAVKERTAQIAKEPEIAASTKPVHRNPGYFATCSG